jgi:hypothetical protein
LVKAREIFAKKKKKLIKERKEKKVQAGRHWWKPRPSGRTQSTSLSLKIGGRVFWVFGDGEYVVGVVPAFPAILGDAFFFFFFFESHGCVLSCACFFFLLYFETVRLDLFYTL